MEQITTWSWQIRSLKIDRAAIWQLWSDLSLVLRYSHLSRSHKAKSIETIAERFHNAIHNGPISDNVVELAERPATV